MSEPSLSEIAKVPAGSVCGDWWASPFDCHSVPYLEAPGRAQPQGWRRSREGLPEFRWNRQSGRFPDAKLLRGVSGSGGLTHQTFPEHILGNLHVRPHVPA